MMRDLLRCYTRPVPPSERHDPPGAPLSDALLLAGGGMALVLAGAALAVLATA